MTSLAASAWAADQPTTAPRSLTDDLRDAVRRRLTEDVGKAVRERVAEYQPLIEQARKASSNELQKLVQWEYKVVTARTSDPDELTATLNQWGEQGWECFHVVSAAPPKSGDLPAEHLLFLRKHKGSWLSQLPLREILRAILYLSTESGGQAPTTP
jgi:hypothetical protein